MPIVAPLAEGAYVEIVSFMGPNALENTLWFDRPSGGNSPATRATLGSVVGFWWNANILPYLSWELETQRVQVTDASVLGALPVSATYFPHIGDDPDSVLPANVAVVMSFLTAVSPGGSRGRNFVGGVTKRWILRNAVLPTLRSGLQEGYSNLIDQVAAVGWRWVAVSQYLDNAARPAAVPYRVDFPRILFPFLGQRRRRLRNPIRP